MNQLTARIIYKCVFLPRITYKAEIWEKGLNTKKTINKLGSIQRRALLACSGAYRTTSTSAHQAITGLMPLEIKNTIMRQKLKRGAITYEEYENGRRTIIDKWETRWVNEEKGDWTRKMIPSVKIRLELPMYVDHYTSQLLSGHGDFKGKLHQFKLVDTPNCDCGNGSETVNHILYRCPRNAAEREKLKSLIVENGDAWPPENGTFIKTRKNYEGLRGVTDRK